MPRLLLHYVGIERPVQAINQRLFIKRLIQESASAGVQHP
jgi:hypothetical protein